MSPDQTVLRVRIDRGRWLRGTTEATLRNPKSGHECIVGSIARAAGIPAKRIEKHNRISATSDQRIPAVLHEFDADPHDTPWTEDPRAPERRFSCRYLLYTINDDPLLGNAAREHMLTAVAAQISIELSFTGTALPPHAIPPTTDGRAGQAAISRGDRSDKPARRLQFGQKRPHPRRRLAAAGRDKTRSRLRPGDRLGLRLRPAAQRRLRAERRGTAHGARHGHRPDHRRRLSRTRPLNRAHRRIRKSAGGNHAWRRRQQ